jgi:lysophospholipase L1-like esterase
MSSPVARLLPAFRLQTGVVVLALLTACSQSVDERNGAGGSAGTARNQSGSAAGTTDNGGGASVAIGGGGLAGSGNAGVAGMTTGGGGLSNGGGGSGNETGGGGAGSVDTGGTGGNGTAGTGGGATGGATNLQPTTVWIAGDSTVMTYAAGNTDGHDGTSLEGWGQELGAFFNDKVTINNQAIGGRSIAFFMWAVVTDGAGAPQCTDDLGTPQFRLNNGDKVDTAQWAKIKSGIKPGDFLLVQFGHNDETHTCPRFVSVTDYAKYLGFMAEMVMAKGATPIFVTPMGHRTFTGTQFNNTLLPYAQSMKGAAQLKSLEVVDLNLRSGEYYEKVGDAFLAKNIFDGGTTHFIKAGAVEMATLIAGELKKQNGPLAHYLK